MRDYRQLSIYSKSYELSLLIYEITKNFPKNEQFGLIDQIRRASVSIFSNIAEGCGKDSNKEFRYYLSTSIGSLFETEGYVNLAKDLGYLNIEKYNNVLEKLVEVRKMLLIFKAKTPY